MQKFEYRPLQQHLLQDALEKRKPIAVFRHTIGTHFEEAAEFATPIREFVSRQLPLREVGLGNVLLSTAITAGWVVGGTLIAAPANTLIVTGLKIKERFEKP